MKLAAAGLKPRLPPVIDEPVTFVIPVFARRTELPAPDASAVVPSSRGPGPTPAGFGGLCAASAPVAPSTPTSESEPPHAAPRKMTDETKMVRDSEAMDECIDTP